MFDRAQTGTVTVTLASGTDISGWAVEATLQTAEGTSATVIATKTVGSGITSSYATGTQTWVITFSSTNLDQNPGGYVWQFRRTDSGQQYQIVEPSGFIIRPNAAGGGPRLTNLSEYLIHSLGNATLSANDALKYTQLLFAAEDQIKRWTQRDFVYRSTVTEYYDGSGTQNLCLRRTPIPADGIISVYLDYAGNAGSTDGSFGADTLLTEGEDYYLDPDSLFGDGMSYSGILKRIDAVWPLRRRRPQDHLAYGLESLPGCLKVTYAAGYTLIPYALKRAVWDMTTFLALNAQWGRIPTSESGEGYSRSFGSWDEEAKSIASVSSFLAPFQRLYPG